jgi:molybdenum-dependent DNA-binding transcriptional regulator ModE
MRGKKRTKEEQYELIGVLEEYLEMGFSLKRACSLAGVPYSSVRDIISVMEPLRASVTAAQNRVNAIARQNIISSIERGNVNDSKWWMERFDRTEVIIDPVYGDMKEAMKQVIENKLKYSQYRYETLEELDEALGITATKR